MARGSKHEKQWRSLLSDRRIGRKEKNRFNDSARNEYQRDYDRVVFSSAFRRLQDKTQVFPLSRNDFTRTRLTHSIEVSCVGRTLGRRLNDLLRKEYRHAFDEVDLGSIVAAACLAHDIGNPPFGHSGEAAIQSWAKLRLNGLSIQLTPQQRQDLLEFEGNAQGLRVITRLQSARRRGGLQLTLATIGATMKYPCGSLINGSARDKKRVEQKKFGYFRDDKDLVIDSLRETEMIEYETGAFRRHPLAYLVEAADDICYAIVDLEDSVDQGLVSVADACDALAPIAKRMPGYRDKGYRSSARLQWLRAYSIQVLIDECMDVFGDESDSILDGQFVHSLLESSSTNASYNRVLKLVRSTAYVSPRVLAVELAGFQVIGGLLDFFVEAVLHPKGRPNEKIIQLLPIGYLGGVMERTSHRQALERLTPYQRILSVTDYISGMTDSFAVNLYQNLSGITIPQ